MAAVIPDQTRLITASDAARYLGVTKQTIHRWAERYGWVRYGEDSRGRRWYKLEDVLATWHGESLAPDGDDL